MQTKYKNMKRSLLFLLLAWMTALVVMPAGCRKMEIPPDNMAVVNKALYDTASNFYVEFNEYPDDMRSLPIGVFDSGTGGLTVLDP